MSTDQEKQPLKAKLLIVDDEVNTCKVLKRAFGLMGYQADTATSGGQAIAMLAAAAYDVVLLDLRMPEIDGVEVMQLARQKYPDLIVIILTAHATINSAIAAVKAGAFDYLIKPQTITELQTAVEKAIERRDAQMQRKHLISVIADALRALKIETELQGATQPARMVEHSLENEKGSVSLDLEKRRLFLNGEFAMRGLSVDLTANEAAILAYLMQNPDRVFSNRELATSALGYFNISEKEAKAIIRPHITRLRKKIEADVNRPLLIRTVRGRGYLFSLS